MRRRKKALAGFQDDIPLMVDRACRINGLTRAEVGAMIGYSPESMSRLCNGQITAGMPLGKLVKLLELSMSTYEWRRKYDV